MSKSGNKQFRKKGINFSTKVGTKFFSRTYFLVYLWKDKCLKERIVKRENYG